MCEQNFLVQVSCMTYNHVNYITDAMNGFAMQQTSFPFVCIIVDDASTDGEPDVIKKYLDDNFDKKEIGLATEDETDEYLRIYARHKENKNCYFCVLLLKYNHYSLRKPKMSNLTGFMKTIKYLAVCEGDDYWTDPMKLQKQVDFLEGHEEYSMCFHAAVVSVEGVDGSKIGAKCENIESKEYTSTQLYENWLVPTASIVYKKDKVNQFKMKHPEWLTRGDIGLVLKCSHTGKVFGMSDKMSVYRMQPNSVSHNPKYRIPASFKLPNHFRCIYINFPEVNKRSVAWNISRAYYSRMKNQNSFLLKIRDFCLFVYWDPQSAFSKIKEMVIGEKQK